MCDVTGFLLFWEMFYVTIQSHNNLIISRVYYFAGVKTDVFEVLYQKPSSTRSSTQSEHTTSHHGNGKHSSPSSPMRHPEFDGGTYRKPKLHMDKWRQQEVHDDEDKKVLVGQNFLVDREKWNGNQFIKFDTQQRRQKDKSNSLEAEDMKYRTFSKRSFRPDFIDPTDNRALAWFVDTAEGEGEDREKREYTGPPVRLFNRKPVTRAETFRVEGQSEVGDAVSNRRSINEPIRVEIKQSDSGVKVVPIGVAAPYNSHRNVTISTRSPSLSRSLHKPSSYSTHEPIKIIIDRNNQSSVTRDRGSPPPPYSSQNTHKSPQRTFSSSTVVIGGDDREDNYHNQINRRTVTHNDYSQRSERKSGYEDVLNAVRAPNSFRLFNGSAVSSSHQHNHSGGVAASKTKPMFVSTIKVKPHRPAWR